MTPLHYAPGRAEAGRIIKAAAPRGSSNAEQERERLATEVRDSALSLSRTLRKQGRLCVLTRGNHAR